MADDKDRKGIISLTIKDKNTLYASYMPFIKNGGLFISTKRPYQLGEEIFILLSLLDDPERLPIAGRVIWITPEMADAHRVPGVGVQFIEQDNGFARNRIEMHLVGSLNSDKLTHTL